MALRVAIINHGQSNLNSIARAIDECGGRSFICNTPDEVSSADKIILPGVGSFCTAINSIREKNLDVAIMNEIHKRSIPILGICLGMQLLADRSSEGGDNQGLGLIPGQVVKLNKKSNERIPHVGWNSVFPTSESVLFKNIKPGTDFYFVHSYHLVCDSQYIVSRTPYCGEFVSSAVNGSIFSVQFHPEKSQKAGFTLLTNFLSF